MFSDDNEPKEDGFIEISTAAILLIESGRYLIWDEPGTITLPKHYRRVVRVHPEHHDHLAVIEKILTSDSGGFLDCKATRLPGVLGTAFVTENEKGDLAVYAHKIEGTLATHSVFLMEPVPEIPEGIRRDPGENLVDAFFNRVNPLLKNPFIPREKTAYDLYDRDNVTWINGSERRFIAAIRALLRRHLGAITDPGIAIELTFNEPGGRPNYFKAPRITQNRNNVKLPIRWEQAIENVLHKDRHLLAKAGAVRNVVHNIDQRSHLGAVYPLLESSIETKECPVKLNISFDMTGHQILDDERLLVALSRP